MADEETSEKRAKKSAGKGPMAGTSKAPASDTASATPGGPAAAEGEEKKAEEAYEEQAEASAGEDMDAGAGDEGAAESPAGERDEGLSEEDIRRLAEERLERITVADIVFTIMNELASVGYMKMGLPESANLKYRDFDQAGLAIDVLEGMIKAAAGRLPEEHLKAFRNTLANMQMNFVQLRRNQG